MWTDITDALVSWGLWAALIQISLVIGVTVRVMLTRHPAGSSFAWILLTTILPFVGFIFYLLFGERTLGRWHARKLRSATRRMRQYFRRHRRTKSLAPIKYRDLVQMATRLGKHPLTTESSLTLLEDTAEILTRLEKDIDAARDFILMEFYIWDVGGLADNISAAIVRAARRGVKCFVLVDAIGSRKFLKSEWIYLFKDAGVFLEEALPVNLFSALLARADIRLHRKIAVIDGETAYSGSLNMIDPHFFKASESAGQWVDAMVRAKGDIVNSLYELVEFDWRVLTDSKEPIPSRKPKLPDFDVAEQATVMVVPSGPGTGHDANQRILLQAIHTAKKRIQIVSPYFIPDTALIIALENAAFRGVKVELILPEKSDTALAGYAARRHFEELLQSGININLFTGGVLHTKSIVVDDELSLFGTVNMDMRSFHLNYELMLLVLDREFCQKLTRLNFEYLRQCRTIDLSYWLRRSFFERIKEGASHLLSPLL